MKKIFVFDSNVPMLDARCVDNFEDNDVVIPSICVKELNRNKKKKGEAGKFARDFTNYLENLDGDIYEGVELPTGGTLLVSPTYPEIAKEVEAVFHELENDEYVLSVAIHLHREYLKNKERLESSYANATTEEDKENIAGELALLKPVILVSRDTNVRLKAKKFKVPAQTYETDSIKAEDLYDGYKIVPVPALVLNQYFIQKNRLEGDGKENFDIVHPHFKEVTAQYTPYQNEYLILVDEDTWIDNEAFREQLYGNPNAPVVKYIEENGKGKYVGLISLKLNLSRYNIQPRNLHQTIMVDVVADPKSKQKSIVGTAGSGKTLFALLVSLILTNDFNLYDEIIITRPTVEAEYELGYLPGNEEEKMNPYLRGFQGNLKFIVNQMNLNKNKAPKAKDKEAEAKEYDFAKFNIRTESMGFMRGETTYRQIVIIDESQNSTATAMKTALTRIGEESLIIVLGDVSQIDYYLVDALTNGLAHAVELMKDDDLASHVTLALGERSELSKRIAEKWDAFAAGRK